MPFIPLECPYCGGNLTVDSDKEAAICEFCGKPYIVKDAIVQTYINSHITNINAENVNVYTQKDFKIISGTLYSYLGESADVVIPNNVSAIHDNAFSRLSIRSVTIPNSVTSIGQAAFEGCTVLTNINIPNGVSSMEKKIFWGCKSLESITLPNSVTSIGLWAFAGCTSLKSITIPDSVTSIDNNAFEGCTALTSITIPDSVIKIGDNAFKGCTHLSIIKCNNWLKFPTLFKYPYFQARLKEMNRCPVCGEPIYGIIKKKCLRGHRTNNN